MTTPALELVLARLAGVKGNGHGYVALCPAHDDRSPSLSVSAGNDGRALLHCHAGCDTAAIVSAMGLGMVDLMPPGERRTDGNPHKVRTTITVDQLAADKRLPASVLESFGVKDTTGGVFIPYRLMDSYLAPRQRARTALSAKAGSVWLPGNGSPIPYGLDRIMDAREEGFLVLVEGESDCWTLWYHGIPALGIPGADMTGKIQAEHLAGIPEIFYWREPDKGGDTFAAKLPAKLREIGFIGQIWEMKIEGVKDPNELHKKDPEAFKTRFQEAMRKATPPATQAKVIPVTIGGLEDFRATDLWNARLFVDLHGDKVRYCERLGGWHYFDGKRWERETCGEVEQLAKDIPRAMYQMAANEPNETKRQAIAKHAGKTEAAGKLAAILDLAKTEQGIAVPPEAFDAHPWKFNTVTGTLDLQTGKLLPHRPEDMLTNLSPAEWHALNAKGKRFEAFLFDAMDGDQEKIDFLQRAAGFTLSGDMREQVFLFLHGPEAAGKGTFIRALADILGTYARSTEISTFLTSRRDAVRNDVASLVGSRLVTASEPEDGQIFDEGLIKILTGQDRTTARFLFREAFEFSATFKLWLQGNHRPHIRSTGGAMWRRLLIIPFTRTVPEDRRDKTLGEKLKTPEERAGILAWMVRGCLEWQRAGLRPPDSVRGAVAEYRAAEDRLAPFLEECTAASEHGEVPAGQLYAKYKTWAEGNGERAMPKRSLGLRLEEKGFTSTRTTGGTRVWRGLFLVDRGDEK